MVSDMRVHLPGLMRETQRSGRETWRVRVAGDKRRKIALGCGPDHPDFMARYQQARRGIKPGPLTEDDVIPESLAWLTLRFERAMHEAVQAGRMHPATLRQRRGFYARLRAGHGDKHMLMPAHKLREIRDAMQATPGAADNMVKAVRAMYRWAQGQGIVRDNPAAGIERINRSTGATPWTVDDLKKFRARHPRGTPAHLALTLFMFTGCRISDAIRLGRAHEVRIDGQLWLDWQPSKRGSARVTIPVLPPLAEAIAAQKVVGPTYLLTRAGQPFRSAEGLRNRLAKWCAQAGIEGRSAHGIRKAGGQLMALMGATQHEIMAVHGHTQASTSEVYTRGVDRQRLAASAMSKLGGLDW